MVDTEAGGAHEAVRALAKGWLEESWDPGLAVREWWARLADSGWGFPTWPAEWFGRGMDPQLAGAVREAFAEVGALGAPASLGQGLGAPTLVNHASEEQKQRYLPALARGEEYWCQLFSEPGAGSDLASLQTRAERDGDEWVVNGQKVWTSGAQLADRGMLVARTSLDVPKHRGITYFIIDIDQPGIEVRPIHQMNGAHGFNEVFFTDARVTTDRVVGDIDEGWSVALTTLAFERFGALGAGMGGASPGAKAGLLDAEAGAVATGAVRAPREGAGAFAADTSRLTIEAARTRGLSDDPVTRQNVARLYELNEIAKFSALRSAAAVRSGKRPGSEGSVRKLARSEMMRTARDVGVGILGPHGALVGPETPLKGMLQQVALSAPSASIAGGTDEIQHNIIGERVLGLPKEPQIDRDVPFRDLKVGTQWHPAG